MATKVTSQSLSETSLEPTHLIESSSELLEPSLLEPQSLGIKSLEIQSSSLPDYHTPSLQVATSLRLSFKFAGAGLAYTFQTQRNFRIHLISGTVVLGMSLLIGLPRLDFAIISLTIAIILMMELLNTALEAVVDLTVGKTYHHLAKVAKDCAAGAVLVAAIAALVEGFTLIAPRIFMLLGLV
jgi:diacylglycerol kinase (ATP)